MDLRTAIIAFMSDSHVLLVRIYRHDEEIGIVPHLP